MKTSEQTKQNWEEKS